MILLVLPFTRSLHENNFFNSVSISTIIVVIFESLRRNRNMTKIFRRLLLGLFIVGILFASDMYADTFEFLNYTPPAGWAKQVTNEGVVYKRATGVGAITIYASYPATGAAANEFEKFWQMRLGSVVPGAAPRPKVEREGDYAVAIGGQQVSAQDAVVSFSLVTFVGRGRAIGVMMVTAGDNVLNEATAFLNTLSIAPVEPATAASSTTASAIEVDFDVPAGYVSQRDGQMVVLKPSNLSRATPCIYGISPARPSRGSLELDARVALLEPLPGWQFKSDHYNAMRGTAGAGWSYYWMRTDVQRRVGPSFEYMTAMAMAFPSGTDRVSIFWGFGSTGPCTLDDLTFLRLFFSLRPRGWTADGGKALGRELQGLWRDTQNVGMAQYKFLPNGLYQYGLGTSTTFGNLETRTGGATDGRYVVRDSELTIFPIDLHGRGTAKFRVRVYDEFLGGVWRRAMSLLNEGANPPLDVHYMRVDDSK